MKKNVLLRKMMDCFGQTRILYTIIKLIKFPLPFSSLFSGLYLDSCFGAFIFEPFQINLLETNCFLALHLVPIYFIGKSMEFTFLLIFVSFSLNISSAISFHTDFNMLAYYFFFCCSDHGFHKVIIRIDICAFHALKSMNFELRYLSNCM